MWTDPGWFIHQLEVWICLWSSAVRLCILVFLWRTDTIIFAKLNKFPLSKYPPSPSLSVFEISAGFTVCYSERWSTVQLHEKFTDLVIVCHGVNTIKLSQAKISTSEVIILDSEISSHTCVFFLKFLMNLSLVAFPK